MAGNEISIAIKADASCVKPAINDAKQGMADLATQIAGATQQFSAGVSPMTVFSDHAHDAFSAIAQISGVTTGFIGFMGGPWGVVLSSAVSVLSSLWQGHQKAAEKEGVHRSAAQELNGALSHLDKITGRGNKTTEQSVRDSEQAAQATYNHTLQIRENTLELSPGSKDKFVADIKNTFQSVGKVIGTTADDQKVKWKSVADSISNAFGSSLQGMIKGTQSFRGMMLNIGNAILGEATKWIQKKVSAFLTGELAQTAATTAGVTTRTGIEATGAATSQGISATNSLAQIGHSAAVAAAGAYAAIAKIPIVGPILAPIAAAAALAGVIALGKSIFSAEGGMGQVPYDGAMFELHKDEMVLPASLATPMRSMLLNPVANNNTAAAANDGAVTHNHYYDIKAMDGQDVHRVLMRHHTSVARAANKAYRYGYKPA
jgi:hypothetical protein